MDVLLVEDEDLVRETLTEDLTSTGLVVVASATAEAALAEAAADVEPPAVVVTDVDLGSGMNGLALVARARARWPLAWIVVMSGDPGNLRRDWPDTRMRSLQKPLRPTWLATEVHALLGRSAP